MKLERRMIVCILLTHFTTFVVDLCVPSNGNAIFSGPEDPGPRDPRTPRPWTQDFFRDKEFADFRASLDAGMKNLQSQGIGSKKDKQMF